MLVKVSNQLFMNIAIGNVKPEETPEYYQLLADLNLAHAKYLQATLVRNRPKLSIKLKPNAITPTGDLDESDEEDPNKRHKCTTCDKGFSRPHHLKRHMKTHEITKEEHKCTLCPSTFARDDNLLRHMREVHHKA